jgi:rhomboid protease GluP
MLDLNHIFLFVACLAPLVLLAQNWRRGGLNRAWRLAAVTVLLVTAVSWIWNPDIAGFVGGGAWLALLFLPQAGLRKAFELLSQQRYGAARRLVSAIRFVHPAGDLPPQLRLIQAMESAQRGDIASALSILEGLRDVHSGVGLQATAQFFRIRDDWTGLIRWIHNELPGGIRADLSLMPLYLRALGETGARDELVMEFANHAGAMNAAPQLHWPYDLSLMVVLAFGGRVETLTKLFQTRLQKISSDAREFWLGTAELAANEIEAGSVRLQTLQDRTRDELVRVEVMRRLERAQEFSRRLLSVGPEALLHRIKLTERTSVRVFGAQTSRLTPGVLILIGLNVAMFIAELVMGGSTNFDTLYKLGALDLFSVRFAGEYWRLVTSLFLHYGPLHLLFNLYALSVIGPGLETAIGAVRFTICYLISGLGSSLGVLLLYSFGLSKTEQLVGASGCVMGLVGVWAGLLLRHRDTPHAGRRLKHILVIVAIQTAFDLSTPQISMAAHLSGLVTGLILGFLIAPRKLPA